MSLELTAFASLNRNIKFWVEQCGCKDLALISKINHWFNFAYSPAEQEKAKTDILEKMGYQRLENGEVKLKD
ncbi:hypothetical protein FH968_19975 [Buttiauxella sp. B2]|uniref:hypothetical protein n=1 Tax=Buttiauxella sp. B2 TaxID=2587812 RepID=UPI001122A4D3|nr:hypothetical protein [Buttiauxella sp. B2]TNV16119.1 hypothetical protein FH968_19975 [Buttiauxella sp. B2]